MTQQELQAPYYEYEEIDLRDILKTLGKWKKTIAGVTIIAMLLSGVISFFLLDPVYEASTVVAVVQAQPDKETSADIKAVVEELGELPYISVESCEQQIKSSGILQAVIEEMGLEMTRKEFKNMITTEQIKNTNLIRISVQDNNPEMAAKMANLLREKFVEHINEVNSRKMAQSVSKMENEWLKKEESELQEASDRLKDYKLQTRSTEFLSTQISKKTQKLTDLQSQLSSGIIEKQRLISAIAQEEENLENTPAKIQTVTEASGFLPAELEGIEIKDGTIIREQINAAYIEILKSLNDKKAALAALEAGLKATRQEISSLEQEITALEAELTKKQIEEKRLQNEVNRREEIVNLLTSKIAELKTTQSLNIAENNIITVSEALAPEGPVKPNKLLNVAIAGVLGLMLSVFGVFLAEYLREEEAA